MESNLDEKLDPTIDKLIQSYESIIKTYTKLREVNHPKKDLFNKLGDIRLQLKMVFFDLECKIEEERKNYE